MTRFARLSVVVSLLAVAPMAIAAGSMDAWVGTWTLNVAKSTFAPGPPPSGIATTARLEVVNGVLQITVDAIDEGGQPIHTMRAVVFDGAEHGGQGTSNRWTYRWLDANHYEWVTKVAGRVTTTTRLELSHDGLRQTLRTTGLDARGQRVDDVTLFEKK
jgi:hypothetical protein